MALRNLLLIGYGVVMVWWWFAGTRAKRKADDACRRVGWRYGYGQGYIDAQKGREYDFTPPADGRIRHGSPQARSDSCDAPEPGA